jgi:hypothetical protein
MLEKGQCYTRKDLGITDTRHGHVKHEGKEYLFVTIKNDGNYQNELQWDGLVHEPGADSDHLAEYGLIKDDHKGMYIMVRYHPKGPYEYMGELEYLIRYDAKRNKLFVKQ